DAEAAPLDKLIGACQEYAVFCLSNGSFFNVLITSGSGRVDEPEPELEVNQIRNRIFGHLIQALDNVVDDEGSAADAEAALNRARILFYYMQGFVHTYNGSLESIDSLLERTLPIYNQGIRTLVAGMKA
ncbi:hypothetical protein K0U00_16675, partial [Paenibacillus sepulcri]|nr:hypothetical protein [Paenibacillus sepulcri]